MIRYWAAQGLLMLKAAAAPAVAALEKCLERDASHSVRIVAAEALALLGSPERSLQYLTGLLEPDVASPLRLQALNALTFMGSAARPALAAVERAIEHPGHDVYMNVYIQTAGRYLSLVLNGKYEPSSRIYQGPAARDG